MDLLSLSIEYRATSDACLLRVNELQARLETERMTVKQRDDMRRRIGMLTKMSRNTRSIARRLREYCNE